MTVSASTRFRDVTVNFYQDVSWEIRWTDSNGISGDVEVFFNGDVRTEAEALIAALRAHYEGDGFLDADGNPITIALYGFIYGSTIESIEANGFMNPLSAASVTRAARMRDFDAAVLTELASVTEDAISERPDAAIKFGVVPTRRAPAQYSHSLDRWFTETNNSTSFNFVVNFVAADSITVDNAGERVDIQAMIRWLSTIRASGDEVILAATTHAEIAAAIARGRTYSFVQSATETVTARCVGVTYASDRYTISFIEEDDSAASHAAALLDVLLESTAITLTSAEPGEEPPFGAYDVAAQASALEFDAQHRLSVLNRRLVMRGHDADGTPYYLDLGNAGRTVRFADLQDFDTSAKKLPAGFAQNVIHFGPSATADGTLRIEAPSDVILTPSGEYQFTIHNRDSTYSLDLDDWTGSEICTLHPGERITLRLTRRSDGSGELVDAVPFIRQLHVSGSNYGFMPTDNNWFWQHDEGAKYIRCIRMPEDSHQFSQRTLHEDAFAVGTLTYQFDGSPGVYTGANLNTIHSVNVRRAGLLRCEFNAELYFGGTSGQVPQGSGLRLALQNGSSNVALRTVGQPQLNAPAGSTLQTAFQREVSHGDIIAPLWFYPQVTSVLLSDIRNVSYHLEMTLEQSINLEYAAA